MNIIFFGSTRKSHDITRNLCKTPSKPFKCSHFPIFLPIKYEHSRFAMQAKPSRDLDKPGQRVTSSN